MDKQEATGKPGRVTGRVWGTVGYVIFENDARRNAMSLEMLEQAESLLHNYEDNEDIRAVVITGGGTTFIAGADISRFEGERATAEGIARYNQINERVYGAIYEYTKPTIAMIRGYCIGGGLTMAMACDLRICSEGARFSLPATKLGLGYGHQYLQWFVDQVGPSFTKEIFFTARQFDTQEALAMGLVNRCLDDAKLEEYTLDCATLIGENAPLSVKAVKRTILELLKGSQGDLQLSDQLVADCWRSDDYVEGRRAFTEKRKPNFVGR